MTARNWRNFIYRQRVYVGTRPRCSAIHLRICVSIYVNFHVIFQIEYCSICSGQARCVFAILRASLSRYSHIRTTSLRFESRRYTAYRSEIVKIISVCSIREYMSFNYTLINKTLLSYLCASIRYTIKNRFLTYVSNLISLIEKYLKKDLL